MVNCLSFKFPSPETLKMYKNKETFFENLTEIQAINSTKNFNIITMMLKKGLEKRKKKKGFALFQ